MNNAQSSYIFAVRCYMKEHPFLLAYLNLQLSIFIFGYCLRLFDQNLPSSSFSGLKNPTWASIITMTTVGYGDFYP